MARKKKPVLIPADSDDIAQAKARTTVPFTSFGAGTGARLRSSKKFISVDPTSSSQSTPVLNTPVFIETPLDVGGFDGHDASVHDEVGLDPAYVAHTKTVYTASIKRGNVSVRSHSCFYNLLLMFSF